MQDKNQSKKVVNIAAGKIVGLLIFLAIVWVANFLLIYIDNQYYAGVVQLVNQNLWLLIIMALLFAFGELFGALQLPFNLPAPVFNAIGAVFLLRFVYRVIDFAEETVGVSMPSQFELIQSLLIPIVFILVIVIGYIIVLSSYSEDEPGEKDKKPGKKGPSWEDVGTQFRKYLYDLFSKKRKDLKN